MKDKAKVLDKNGQHRGGCRTGAGRKKLIDPQAQDGPRKKRSIYCSEHELQLCRLMLQLYRLPGDAGEFNPFNAWSPTSKSPMDFTLTDLHTRLDGIIRGEVPWPTDEYRKRCSKAH